MPKTRFEQPIHFIDLLAEAQTWEGGFKVHTPDSIAPTFIDELLDLHFPDRDKTEYLGPEITDADIFRDLLAGEYVTPHDTVLILEHVKPTASLTLSEGDVDDELEGLVELKPPAESTTFISIKNELIGSTVKPAEDRIVTILPIPEAEDTPS